MSTQEYGIDSSGFSEREQSEIVGTTNTFSERERQRHERTTAQRRAADDDRERESGIGVSASLAHELGSLLLGEGLYKALKRNAAAAKKVQHRLDEEFDYLMSLEAGQRDGELLGAAWERALAKTAVPPIMVPALEFDRSTIPTTHPLARRKLLVDRLYAHWAYANREAALAVRPDVEAIIGKESTAILDESVRVYRTLVDATGEVDDAEAVIADGRPEVLEAFKAWPNLVERWRQVQCVRQWMVLVEQNGFDEKHPESLIRTDAQWLEQEVWRSQFVAQRGVEIAHVDTPDAALQWFANKKIETGAHA